jgi:hypothetical protein
VITDPVPRIAKRRAEFERSDALHGLALPPEEPLRGIAHAIEAAMQAEDRAAVEAACGALAHEASRPFGVAAPAVKVLGVRRPQRGGAGWIVEKFGDYEMEKHGIRVWLRTAVRGKVTSYGTLLSTLTHEICHHLDVVHFRFGDSPHTRGFYDRAGLLYHHARGTPPRKLVWMKGYGTTWQIDWPTTMGPGAAGPGGPARGG